jgi:uncharacterized phiE125 gp8 family phage protein
VDSILTVTDAATAFDLTTVSDFKAELKITGTDSDTWLAAKITRLSVSIADECKRTFAEQDYSQTFRLAWCEWPRALQLSEYPVSEVLVTENEDDAPLDDADIEVDAGTGLIYRLCDGKRTTWKCTKAVVTYTAGYAEDEIPAPLQDAAIQTMKAAWFERTRDPNLMSQSSQNAGDQRWYVGSPSGQDSTLPPDIMPILDRYRKVFAG